MSEPIKHRDHLWLVPVFGSTEERAKAEVAESSDSEGSGLERGYVAIRGNNQPRQLQVCSGPNNL